MFRKAQQIVAAENPYLYVMFPEGIKKYDISMLFNEIPVFRKLADDELFSKAHLSPGGYGVIWNDDIDLSVDEIWEKGETVTL